MKLFCMVVLMGLTGSSAAETVASGREKLVEVSNERYSVSAWVEKVPTTNVENQTVHAEVAYLSVESRKNGTRWESRLQFDAEILELVMTAADEFVAISTLINSYGSRVRRLTISDDLSPVEKEALRAYWPYLAPNRKWVFYQYWYPRTGTPVESRHTSTWLVDITRPKMEPKLVYPPDSRTGRAPDGRIHAALTSGFAPLWSEDSQQLYYFDMLSIDHAWAGAVVSLVEVQIGEDMSIDKTTTYPIAVEDFAEPEADLDRLGFFPRDLYWAAEGVIGGKLGQKPGWKSEEFFVTIKGEKLEPDEVDR